MGIDVALFRRSQRGTSRRHAKFEQVDLVTAPGDEIEGILTHAWESGKTPMLDRIDPVGDLVVTSAEAAQLVAELEILRGMVDGSTGVIVDRLADLAHRCAADPVLEIWFQGD